ncbi:MAG: AtpZ/AtpI family protein [Pseudomonadota bacterium]
MADPDHKAQLDRLSERISAVKAAAEPEGPKIEEHHSQAQLVWRMVIELVAGICIGFGMGYGLDYLFGTLPIFLVVMTLLGFAAGVRTMLRSAEEIQRDAVGETPHKSEDTTRGG